MDKGEVLALFERRLQQYKDARDVLPVHDPEFEFLLRCGAEVRSLMEEVRRLEASES